MRVLKVPRKMCIKPPLRDRNAARRSLATFAFPLDFLGCGGGGGGRCSAGAAGSGFGIRTPQNGVYEEGGGLVGHDRDGRRAVTLDSFVVIVDPLFNASAGVIKR